MLRRVDSVFTHRRRHTASALHWRLAEGRKNSERSRACSHTSHSYSTMGPGTHSHLQEGGGAPHTLVTAWTSARGAAARFWMSQLEIQHQKKMKSWIKKVMFCVWVEMRTRCYRALVFPLTAPDKMNVVSRLGRLTSGMPNFSYSLLPML